MIAELGGGIFSKRIVEEVTKKNIPIKLITTSLKDLKFKNKIKSFPVIHFTGSPTVTFPGIFSLIRFRLWGKKIVVSWMGFDIRRVRRNFFWRLTSRVLLGMIDVHTTDDEYVAKELKQVGIPARVQPMPIYLIFSLTKLPEKKKIVVYLPDPTIRDFENYQGNMIRKLVKEFFSSFKILRGIYFIPFCINKYWLGFFCSSFGSPVKRNNELIHFGAKPNLA